MWKWASANSEFLVEYVVGVLKSVSLRGSAGQAEEILAEVLGKENAQIFVHELNAFMRSPFTRLQSFDDFVQYEVRYSLLGSLNSRPANSIYIASCSKVVLTQASCRSCLVTSNHFAAWERVNSITGPR